MKEHIQTYKVELEKSIGEYMERPATERSAEAINGMVKCWKHLNEVEEMLGHAHSTANHTFTREDAVNWVNHMDNEDGSLGMHWSIEQTTTVAKDNDVSFDHITDYCWWVTMNMMYSDYCHVADKYGVDMPNFYADLAKAFLFDKDGGTPEHKLAGYYHSIVK